MLKQKNKKTKEDFSMENKIFINKSKFILYLANKKSLSSKVNKK